jgi:hypothetical protein
MELKRGEDGTEEKRGHYIMEQKRWYTKATRKGQTEGNKKRREPQERRRHLVLQIETFHEVQHVLHAVVIALAISASLFQRLLSAHWWVNKETQ